MKTFKCARCGYSTPYESEMRRHVAAMHTEATVSPTSSSSYNSYDFLAVEANISSDSFSGGGGDFGGGGASGSFD